jgi:polyisoprenoid-binding protein YceI
MAPQTWNIDPAHSSVGFTIRHLMISKVHGNFTRWTGSLVFDEAAPGASSVEAQIEVASVDTREPNRDTHLRTGDFFDVEKFPHMTFKSTKIEGSGSDYKVTGDLTLRGITKPVVLDVEYGGKSNHPQLGERIAFSAHTVIHRKDFGVTFNQILDNGGIALGEKVDIVLEVQASRAP